MPADAVRISSKRVSANPSNEALEAVYDVAKKKGGRYGGLSPRSFLKLAADQEGLKPTYVVPYAGSSDPLFRLGARMFPARGLVMGDPGYEAGARAAEFIGAKVTGFR